MEWIKCEDRLPEHDQVIIGSDGEDMEFFRFSQTSNKRHKKRAGIFHECCDSAFMQNLTHWMEIPNLPKED